MQRQAGIFHEPKPGGLRSLSLVEQETTSDEVALLNAVIAIQTEIATAGLITDDVVQVILRRTQEMTRSSGAVVELLDGDEMVYWVASGTAEAQAGVRLPAATSLSGLSARSGQVLRCDDSETDPRVDRDACRRVGLRSMLVVPLMYRGRPIGVLKVMSPRPGTYGSDDVRALELMASVLGASLGHAATYASLAERLSEPIQEIDGFLPAAQITTGQLRQVIEARDLRIVLQPIFDLGSGGVYAHEALTRFSSEPPHPPDRWFAAAARAGLGLELELAAVEAAFERLADLPPRGSMGVNVSPLAATSRELERLVQAAGPSQVILEITEHAAIDDYDAFRQGLAGMRDDGVRLAVDDAGAGFASFRHILNLSPDLIKLDMSLTRDIDRRPPQHLLVSSLVTFAEGAGATILAEGIETDAELQTLVRLGVRLGQGYHLGRPQEHPVA